MLTESYHREMHSNRRHEKNISLFFNAPILNQELYTNQVCQLLFLCDQCGLKRQTKYVIKRSLDTYVLKNPTSTHQELQFAALNFLRMGAKFNQDSSICDKITIEECMSVCSPGYSREDFINFQKQYYNEKDYSLDFTTPYDYLGTYAKVFEVDKKLMKKIKFVLDFTFTIPELLLCSAQELFFGSMIVVFQNVSAELSWIMSQTHYQQQSHKAFQIIKFQYQKQVQAAQNAQFQ